MSSKWDIDFVSKEQFENVTLHIGNREVGAARRAETDRRRLARSWRAGCALPLSRADHIRPLAVPNFLARLVLASASDAV